MLHATDEGIVLKFAVKRPSQQQNAYKRGQREKTTPKKNPTAAHGVFLLNVVL